VTDPGALFDFVLKILMVSLRAGSLWLFFPVFSQPGIPGIVRITGAFAISVALIPVASPHLPAWSSAHLPGMAESFFFVLRELVIGAGMGLVSKWIFSSILAAAHWAGTQMGFSVGGLVDPEFQTDDSAWARFHQWVGIMLFLAVGGHFLLIEALAESYRHDLSNVLVRLGDPQAGLHFWAEIGGRFFTWMLKLAGPIAVVSLVLQAALGVLSKFVPQINIWAVSFPITIGVGVLVFTMLSPHYGDALVGLFNVTRESNYLWLRFLGAR
jgi:flagellar biosynthesis protein FliR